MMNMQPDPLKDDTELETGLRSSRALQDAPEHVIQRTLAVFAGRPAVEAPRGALRRLLAALSFDSGAAPPLAFGMRSSGGAVRQLLFSVEGRDVDLRISAGERGDHFAISGQVLGPDSAGVVTMQPEDGGTRSESRLSEFGEFRLPPVAAGRYRLTLELTDVAIDLPTVQIPQAV